jgi:hypothetical protein
VTGNGGMRGTGIGRRGTGAGAAARERSYGGGRPVSGTYTTFTADLVRRPADCLTVSLR